MMQLFRCLMSTAFVCLSTVSFAQEVGRFSVPDIAERSVQGVVNISTTQRIDNRFRNDPLFQWFYGRRAPNSVRPEPNSLGSGVLVSDEGLILTNHHVIANAETIKVNMADGRELSAKLIGQDPKSDVAVIQIENPPSDLAPIELGDSDALRLGETVLAIGNPFGLGHTVTMGIVSAKGRANLDITDYENFIQTDAAINPGNSGGALVDANGKLVGINTAIYSRSGGYQGIGFAIPAKMASRIMKSLVNKGRVDRGFLGVGIQNVTGRLAKRFGLETADAGVLVNFVGDSTPAESAGLRVGDIILSVDSERMKTADQLRNTIAMKGAENDVRLGLWRDTKPLAVQVRLGLLPDRKAQALRPAPSQKKGYSVLENLGLEVREMDGETRSRYRLEPETKGVFVNRVVSGGRAARAGLKLGDIIVRANREEIESTADFVRAIGKSEQEVLCRIRRGSSRLFVIL